MAENIVDFEKQEEQLRSILLRILIGVFIALASVLFSLIIPFYPASFAIILALALGALAYRAPVLSLGLMFLLNMPGYTYQGGFGVVLVVAVCLVFLAATLSCLNRPGACLAIATGVIAAVLMFTPVYFLSIPLLVSVILFRARGVATGGVTAILVFLAIYNPFLLYNVDLGKPPVDVPLFGRVQFEFNASIFSIELGRMFKELKDAMGTGPEVAKFLDFYYFFFSGRPSPENPKVLVYAPSGRMLGVVLYLIIAFSIFSAFAVLSAFRWLESREFAKKYLPWIAPTASLLIADAAFLIPLSTLSASFRYTTTLKADTTLLFILGTVGIGIIGSIIEYRLKTRDVSLELRQELHLLLPEIKKTREELQNKLSSIRSVAAQADFHSEDKLLTVYAQEMGYIDGRVGSIPTQDLSQKIALFTDMQQNLRKSYGEAEQKLTQFYNESKEKYDIFISRVKDLGLFGIEVFQGLSAAELSQLGFERAMQEQAKLDEYFDKVGEYLVTIAKESSLLISAEVDREFKPLGLEIAENYLKTRHSQEAIDSALAALISMKEVLDKAALGLNPRIAAVTHTWETVIKSEAVTTMRMVGDGELAQSLLGLKPGLDKLSVCDREKRSFTELIQLVTTIKELNQYINSVFSQLQARTREQEKVIESKVPSGFDWGKNEAVLQKMTEAQEKLTKTSREASLAASLMNVEQALKSIGEATELIKQYIFENEFLINYSNIEYLITLKLEKDGAVTVKSLPIKEKYAHNYLVLYARKHYDRSTFDSHLGVLKPVEAI